VFLALLVLCGGAVGGVVGLVGGLGGFVLPIAAGILIALFMIQSRGTASMARYFGPLTLVWFLILAGLGVWHIFDDPSIFRALSPHYGVLFLVDNGFLGFIILGSVFLAVTGAEALYADMGHFGKSPIRKGWLWVVLPCLTLNYLGQGAMVLDNPDARLNPFFAMIPEAVMIWGRDTAASLTAQVQAQDRNIVMSAVSRAVRLLTQVAMLGWGAFLAIEGQITGGMVIAASIIAGWGFDG